MFIIKSIEGEVSEFTRSIISGAASAIPVRHPIITLPTKKPTPSVTKPNIIVITTLASNINASSIFVAVEEYVPFDVNDSDLIFDTAGQAFAMTIEISEDDWNAAYAGSYSDTVTFNVSYEDVPTTPDP